MLASFTNKVPFLLEREIGAGRVLFVTSGVYRDWNTLTATHAVVLFDRIFRHAIEETLPQRNIASTGRLVLPVPPAERPVSLHAHPARRQDLAVGGRRSHRVPLRPSH